MKTRTLTLPRLALAALLGASQTLALADATQAARYYEDALQRYEKRDLAGAIVQLKSAQKQDRRLLQVQVLLGQALLASGQAPAAEAAFEDALRLGVNRAELVLPWAQSLMLQGKLIDVVESPKFTLTGLGPALQARLLLLKAAAQGDMGELKAALQSAEEARGLDPANAEGWLAEVPLRIRARQLKEAQAAIEKAQALDPQSAAVPFQRGSVLHVQGDLKGALAAYDQTLQMRPGLNDARVARAGLLIDLKRPAEAAKDVALLLEKTPLEPRGWYLSALLAESDDKPQQVKASLTRITELLDPVPLAFIRYRPQMMMLNGQAHFGLGRPARAKPYFEGFARLQPGSPVAKLLSSMLLADGNPDGAAATLEQYLAAAPHDAQAMAMLASAYMAKGRHARAAELMQRAVQKHDVPELYTAYGLSLLGAGQHANALAPLEKAYLKDRSQSQAATALVGLYLRGGVPAKALVIAQALVQKAPANPGFQNLLGMALAARPDLPGARQAFEQALKLDPALQAARLNLARLETGANQPQRAQALLATVLTAESSNTEALFELARLAERQQQPAEALRWLQKAFDVAGVKDLRSSLALVDLHMRQGRTAEAQKVALTLALAAPDSLPVVIALARTQLLNGDRAGARSSLVTANKLAPVEAPVQVEIAVLQLSAGHLPGAAYAAGKALEARPDDLRAQAVMADIHIQQRDWAQAEARAQTLARKAPKLAIGPVLLGDLAMARKQPGQALALYRKGHQTEPSGETFRKVFVTQAGLSAQLAGPLAVQWLKANEQDLATRRLLAELYVKTGNMAAAKGQYERLRQQAPQDAGAANNLANVLAALQDPQALAVADQALALAPADPNVIDTAGWIAHQSGQPERALQLLRDARLRAPEQPVVRYHLGAALIKSGRKAEAAEELSLALASRVGFEGREQAESLLRVLR